MSRESRVLILRLALRAMRWRAAASATVFVVAVIAILAATVGPIYLPAVDEAVLAQHLRHASQYDRNVVISRNTDLGYPGVNWDAQVQRIAGELAHDHLFRRPLREEQIDVNYDEPEPLKSELAYVEGLCAHVRIIHGHCVSGKATDQTVISANTAAIEHLAFGGTLETATTTGIEIPLRVVGIYRPIAPRPGRGSRRCSQCSAASSRRPAAPSRSTARP